MAAVTTTAPAPGMPARPAPAGGRDDRRRPSPWGSAPAVATAAAVLALVAIGVVLRMWLLAHDPIDADEAVVGLMARSILHGHPVAFSWGGAYGGAEPYVAAGLVAVLGLHPWVVNLTPAVLAAATSLVAWRLTRALSGSSAAGALAAACMWAWSEVDLWSTTRATGSDGVVLLCSMLVLLGVVRLLRDDRRASSWVLLGVAVGIGWWTSAEILYVGVPAIVTTAWIATRAVRRDGARAIVPASVGALATAPGLVPWFVGSVHDHFASIRAATTDPGSGATGYLGHLHVFFVHTLPMVLGARVPVSGAWLGGRTTGLVVLSVTTALLAVGVGAAAWRMPAARPVAAAVIAYPFIEAAMGPASYWRDGRYGVYLPAIVLVAAVAGWDRLLRRRQAPLATAGAGTAGAASPASAPGGTGPADQLRAIRAAVAVLACAAATASTVAGIDRASAVVAPSVAVTGFAAHPADLVDHPDGTARSVAQDLLLAGVTRAYADYWAAYDLDLFGSGRLVVTPATLVRSRSMAAKVANAPHPAWLFAGPSGADVAAYREQFQNPALGPMGLDLQQFTALLHANGVAYRTVPTGAVVGIVPGTRITPAWVAAHRARS